MRKQKFVLMGTLPDFSAVKVGELETERKGDRLENELLLVLSNLKFNGLDSVPKFKPSEFALKQVKRGGKIHNLTWHDRKGKYEIVKH